MLCTYNKDFLFYIQNGKNKMKIQIKQKLKPVKNAILFMWILLKGCIFLIIVLQWYNWNIAESGVKHHNTTPPLNNCWSNLH